MGLQLAGDVAQLIAKLGSLVNSGKITQIELQARTGVHQSQVSRILSGKAKRSSRNVEELCKYARTLVNSASPSSAEEPDALQAAVIQIWNGTDRHAQAIKEVLTALDRMQNSFARGE